MVDVIVDQRALRLADGFLNRVELLGQIKAGATLGKHLDDAAEVTFGSFQPLDDIRMGFMNMVLCHVSKYIPPGGYCNWRRCRGQW
jgi:hypothetical protein